MRWCIRAKLVKFTQSKSGRSAGRHGYVAFIIIGATELARRDETTRDFWPNQLYFDLALQNLILTSEKQRGNDD
jgi:hypothetical protein